jgi:hypothetical protein
MEDGTDWPEKSEPRWIIYSNKLARQGGGFQTIQSCSVSIVALPLSHKRHK